jgi:hypothetical protein
MGVRFGVRLTPQPRKPLLHSQLEVVAGGGIGSNLMTFPKAPTNSETHHGTQDTQITLLHWLIYSFFVAGQCFS